MANIAINGFGRIGRMVLRAALERDAEITAINDPSCKNPAYIAYLFKHDSTHGRYCGKVCFDDKYLIVNRMKIRLSHQKDPKKVLWSDLGGHWVIESSGKFTSLENAQSIVSGGAQKVVITAPCKDVPIYICGVNLDKYKSEQIVSMGSCTINSLAPLAKVINDKFGICEALITTLHSVTNNQDIVDSNSYINWRYGRGAFQNIIPIPTDIAELLGKVLPCLDGKITGLAVTVPSPNVSLVDFTVRLKRATDYEAIKSAVKEAADCYLKGILGYTEEQIVSTDLLGSTCSSIFDATAGIGLNNKFFKLIIWYDNEYGYSSRIIDFIRYMQETDSSAKQSNADIAKTASSNSEVDPKLVSDSTKLVKEDSCSD